MFQNGTCAIVKHMSENKNLTMYRSFLHLVVLLLRCSVMTKQILLFAPVLLLWACGDSSSDSVGTSPIQAAEIIPFTDSRDGQVYKTVVIGSQTWMAENLNYETKGSCCVRCAEMKTVNVNYAPGGYLSQSYCAKCSEYGGRLYTWDVATTACPSGWHLPSQDEWSTLFNAVKLGDPLAHIDTRLKSTTDWNNYGNTDDFSFSALPVGHSGISVGPYGSGDCYNHEGTGDYAYFWSSTEVDNLTAYYMYLSKYGNAAISTFDFGKSSGFSVRCVKD